MANESSGKLTSARALSNAIYWERDPDRLPLLSAYIERFYGEKVISEKEYKQLKKQIKEWKVPVHPAFKTLYWIFDEEGEKIGISQTDPKEG